MVPVLRVRSRKSFKPEPRSYFQSTSAFKGINSFCQWSWTAYTNHTYGWAPCPAVDAPTQNERNGIFISYCFVWTFIFSYWFFACIGCFLILCFNSFCSLSLSLSLSLSVCFVFVLLLFWFVCLFSKEKGKERVWHLEHGDVREI